VDLESLSGGPPADGGNPTEEVESHIPQGGHDLRRVSGAYPGPILVERHVPDMMHLILDGPVGANPAQEVRGVGP
jgi:hypothetical protein